MEIPLWLIGLDLLIGSVVFMTLWFGLGQYAKRIDVIDAAWGLAFIYISGLALMLDGRFETFQWIVFGFVAVWGLRLFFHIAGRLQAKGEDPRYHAYRKKWGKAFSTNAFFRIFMVQAVLAVIVSAPAVAAIISPNGVTVWLAAVGFAVWGFGILFEAIADRQLAQFVSRKASRQPDDIMSKGLWKYSRHPNYFGEITAWTGAGIVALSAGQWWGLIGPIVITYLILKVSGIPPLEKRFADNPKYKAYKQNTSVLIPRPPKSPE